MDPMVLMAQQFINRQYSPSTGVPRVTEDGQTGWGTMYALTRCLQYELAISPLSDNFGPNTLSTLTIRYPLIDAFSGTPKRVIQIVQAALYGKGYDGGEVYPDIGGQSPSGEWSGRVAAAVERLKSHTGVTDTWPGSGMVPKLFKALLTMDAYVLVNGGSSTVRSIQQWLNQTYVYRRNFYVIPCDGFFSRDVQKALILAVQFQIGLTDDAATGVFGPGTQAGLKANTLSIGSTGRWVQLFSAAMVFNQREGVAFTDSFTLSLSGLVNQFQEFVKLPKTGNGDFQTWASLLVSTGDKTRKGTAVDCVTEITDATAATLKAAGYSIVGRYLCNVANTNLNKKLQFYELDVIAANGLRCFPIYQTWGDSAGYFTRNQGIWDAHDALDRLRFYGFKPGTRVYFAVDFDAVDSEVTSRVIPYFQGVATTMYQYGSEYGIGVYGPRNVCSRVSDTTLTSASFVSDMSTGYSGNLGYPMPKDWAFDQIATVTIGSGAGQIEIDNDIVSGRDIGQGSFNPRQLILNQDVAFNSAQKPALLADIQEFLEANGLPEQGGGFWETVGQVFTTTQAFNMIMPYDPVFTNLARTLKMRKALIMTVMFWETRHYDVRDPLGDDGVRLYHQGWRDPTNEFIVRDCSTGLGQIFAQKAIDGYNFMAGQDLIDGSPIDRESDFAIWDVWQKLNEDNVYNINAVTHLLFWGAHDLGIRLPALDYTDEESRLAMRRYQGYLDPENPKNNAKIERDSQMKLGVYRAFEKYFGPARN
jgi:peptidoglycan hydrolase-like protein with peptidoglycan-binding domain